MKTMLKKILKNFFNGIILELILALANDIVIIGILILILFT